MVLAAAINGMADTIVTFNHRDFLPAALAFSISIIAPSDSLSTISGRFP